MKITGMTVMAATFGTTIWAGALPAAAEAAAAETDLAICLDLEKGMDRAVFNQAQTIASRIFSDIGVKTEWHRDDRCHGWGHKAILILMTTDTAASSRPGALAYTRLREGGPIQVFYDRVQRAAVLSSRIAQL